VDVLELARISDPFFEDLLLLQSLAKLASPAQDPAVILCQGTGDTCGVVGFPTSFQVFPE
jgi:hypothetical protein